MERRPTTNGTAAPLTGFPSKYNRRLSDILLAAFNHAYAVGERDIAGKLRAMLSEVEERKRPYKTERRDAGPLSQADLWVAFVEARDQYCRLCESKPDSDPALAALEAMKQSYRNWSLG